jgi:hypothetical protein
MRLLPRDENEEDEDEDTDDVQGVKSHSSELEEGVNGAVRPEEEEEEKELRISIRLALAIIAMRGASGKGTSSSVATPLTTASPAVIPKITAQAEHVELHTGP